MSTVTQHPRSTGALSYEDLYRRWEQGNWRATEIDFSADRDGWTSLTDLQRRSGLWLYSMFFFGEDSVTDNLSPYIEAAPTEEQTYFLATQQVDEARHAIFFHRFFHEVLGASPRIGESLEATRAQHNWGYRAIFGRLDRMAAELRRDRSLPKFAQAIALYHLVVEASLAQPGQHFIEDHFAKAGTMPGFSAGMRNVAMDEQRHIGFGVKTLSDCFAASDECKAAVAELLREVLPYSLCVFVPPGGDRRYTRDYGFELEEIYAFAVRSVRMKWRAAGYPLEEMPPGVFPFDPAAADDEVAARVIALIEAGVLSEPGTRAQSSPDVQRRLFELVERTIDGRRAGPRPLAIQWRFSDAEPWHVRVENGAVRAQPGEASHADATVESSWQDWIDIATHGSSPTAAFLRRKLRLRGSPRALARLPLLLGARPVTRSA